MIDTVKIRALVGFHTTMLGSVEPGQVFETKPERAAQLVAEGRAEPYENKAVKHPAPVNTSASPVAQALTEQTAKESGHGGKQKKTVE